MKCKNSEYGFSFFYGVRLYIYIGRTIVGGLQQITEEFWKHQFWSVPSQQENKFGA